MKNDTVNVISKVLLIIAGITWGLIGIFDWDLIGTVFGSMSALTRIVYILFGLAGLYRLYVWSKKK